MKKLTDKSYENSRKNLIEKQYFANVKTIGIEAALTIYVKNGGNGIYKSISRKNNGRINS